MFYFIVSVALTISMCLVQGRRSQAYEPLLLENEREAVADLLQYLESMLLSGLSQKAVSLTC
jgi:hypothetical protein